MRDVLLFALGAIVGLRVGVVLGSIGKGIAFLVSGWVIWFIALVWLAHQSIPVQILAVLVIVLVDLIRNTGGEGIRNPYRGPTTLAGPVQPWQRPDIGTEHADWHPHARLPQLADAGIGDGIYLATGVWNPALVRPLIDDTEEGSNG